MTNYYKFKDQEKKRVKKKRIKEQDRNMVELYKKIKPFSDLYYLSTLLGDIE